MKKLLFASLAILMYGISMGQVKTPVLYVSGTVMAEEKMLVSVVGTRVIEGNVVSAELNGKKTEAKTDNKGHAILDFSSIAGGLSGSGVAIIKLIDKKGNMLASAITNVQAGSIGPASRPVIDQLPKNILNGEALTMRGEHLGTGAKLYCNNQLQEQETLAASDKEMTVLMNVPPGVQSAYVITPTGKSESQTVNIYSLDFALPKSSINPRENVQAIVHYESLPQGTRLVFTNKSPAKIKMTIAGAVNTGNVYDFTVFQPNGTIPVNITGLTRGGFMISLDPVFTDDKKDSLPSNSLLPAVKLMAPANGAVIQKTNDLHFKWAGTGVIPQGGYEIIIKKLVPGQTAAEALKSNNVFFSQDKIYNTGFSYPPNASIDTGKYTWSISPSMDDKDKGVESNPVFYIPVLGFNPIGTHPPTEPTAACPPPDKMELWGSHYYPCVVTEYYATQPGLTIAQQEALNKLIKKIKKLPVAGKGVKLAKLIAAACSINGIYNLWIHAEQPYQSYRYDYVCENGKWVLKNIHQGALFHNDLGWVRVYIGEGVGTYEINGSESDEEINNAIDAAIANLCK